MGFVHTQKGPVDVPQHPLQDESVTDETNWRKGATTFAQSFTVKLLKNNPECSDALPCLSVKFHTWSKVHWTWFFLSGGLPTRSRGSGKTEKYWRWTFQSHLGSRHNNCMFGTSDAAYWFPTHNIPQVDHHVHVRGPGFKLPLPGGECWQGHHHQERPIQLVLVEQVGQEGDGLDGLSKTHLIGKDNTVAPEEHNYRLLILHMYKCNVYIYCFWIYNTAQLKYCWFSGCYLHQEWASQLSPSNW